MDTEQIKQSMRKGSDAINRYLGQPPIDWAAVDAHDRAKDTDASMWTREDMLAEINRLRAIVGEPTLNSGRPGYWPYRRTA